MQISCGVPSLQGTQLMVSAIWKVAMTLCANCFDDHGLHLTAANGSKKSQIACVACGKVGYEPICRDDLLSLSHSFFVRGSFYRTEFGGAPAIEFNDLNAGSWVPGNSALQNDVKKLQRELGIGFFEYGPRLWMVGNIEPLQRLQKPSSRGAVIDDIIRRYPHRTYQAGRLFYRLRSNPKHPNEPGEYDAPPLEYAGRGRLDRENTPALYGSEDIELCVHECRVTVEDEIYLASVTPISDLKVLDLTEVIEEPRTEFESLDLSVHMLFLAGAHAYPITREIAAAAMMAGFDGLIYPSFFSLLRTGGYQLDTVYGISARTIPQLVESEREKIVPNLAVFGRPIEAGKIEVKNINRLMLNLVRYQLILGPLL
jgi:hypothetical protein